MLLNSNNDIIASTDSDLRLTVGLTNYYIRSNEQVYFTLNGESVECEVKDRINVIININVTLPVGTYKYDLAIIRDGVKILTILDGDFVVKESLKNYLIGLVHKLYRGDTWLNNLFSSAGIALSEVKGHLETVENDNFFDTATESRLRKYEREAKITLLGGQNLEDRRSQLEAKWKGASKCTLETLQSVANSWRNATIKVGFINGKIHIQFISPIGVPRDLPALRSALEDVKPAHLAIEYSFLYKTWGQAKEAGTWGYHKNNGNWEAVRNDE